MLLSMLPMPWPYMAYDERAGRYQRDWGVFKEKLRADYAEDLQLDDLPPEALHSQLVAGVLGPRQPALLLQGR